MKSTCALLGLFLLFVSPTLKAAEHKHDGKSCSHAHQEGDTTPLSDITFIQNKTQWHPNVNFKASLPGGALFMEDRTFTYCYMNSEDYANLHDFSHLSPEQQAQQQLRYHSYKVRFLGNANTTSYGKEKHNEYYNYFIGQDESKWSSEVPVYDQVYYDEIFKGVDLVGKSIDGQFKYDLIVEPLADMRYIYMAYEGVEGLKIKDGELIIKTSVGDIIEAKPYAYQVVGGVRKEVEIRYAISGNTVHFIAPNGYDRSKELVIDPTVIASTLSGMTGSNSNYGHCATYDDAGNIYTGAISFGTGYPTTTGAFQTAYNAGGAGFGTDIAVSKLSPDGSTLIWASYLGGGEGEYPHSMFVSPSNELTVYGSTTSSDFPCSANAYDNSFNGPVGGWDADITVTKFNVGGTALVGSSYVGGTGNDGRNMISTNYGDQYRGEIILDQGGNIYIASFAQSTDFPTTGGAVQGTNAGGQDAVVFKMNPDCSALTWSTYLGSTGDDSGYGLRLDATGNVYVTGAAGGAGFPVTAGTVNPTFIGGTQDGFIVELNTTGTAILAGTFVGSTEKDEAFFIDIDLDGDIYVYGQNAGVIAINPATCYGQANSAQFIASFTPDLATENFITVFGTGTAGGGGGWVNYDCVPIAFMVDKCGYIYVSGHSVWNTMPTSTNALYTSNGFYLMVLEPDAVALEYATYYEGADHVDGGTSRFDPNGVVYQAVCTAGVFPTTATAWDQTQPTSWDIGVFKIDFQVVNIDANATANPSATGCAPFTVDFTNASVGTDYIWDFDDGSPTDTAFEPTHTFMNPGVYDVQLIAIDSSACITADTMFLQITVSQPSPVVADFVPTVDCSTLTVAALNTSTGNNMTFDWDMGDLTLYTDTNVNHTYVDTGAYTITLIVNDTACFSSDTSVQNIYIPGNVVADMSVFPDSAGCIPFTVDFTNTSEFGVTYTWDFDDGSPLDASFEPSHTYTTAGQFQATLIVNNPNSCNLADTTSVTITVGQGAPVIADFTAEQTSNCNELMVVTTDNSSGDNLVWDWDMGDMAVYTDTNVTHYYANTGTYTITLIVQDTVCYLSDTMQVNVTLTNGLGLDLGPDVAICPGGTTVLDAGAGYDTYLWNTTETTQTITALTPGQYYVDATLGTCFVSDSINVSEAGSFDLGYTTQICLDERAVLEIGVEGDAYEWSTGETGRVITVQDSGAYAFTVTVDGCTYADTIVVESLPSSSVVYVPNAFTPNGDGVNDFFKGEGLGFEEYELVIFDRWGGVIFIGESTDVAWDGTKNGSEMVQNGVYVYKLTYTSPCQDGKKITKFGHVVVVR